MQYRIAGGEGDATQLPDSETLIEKQLKQKVIQLGIQKKIAVKENIFDYYDTLLRESKIDKDSYDLAVTVLSAPATQVSVERSFSALALVMEPHRICLKGDLIDDILVCALNKDLLDLVDFNMQ